MEKNNVFFIGLGLGGSTIVSQLKKRLYDGIMIDCSDSNMKYLKMQEEKDYYLLGGTSGTGKNRRVGKENIQKDLCKIQDKLITLQKTNYVVIIACANSGVSGGSEVLVKEIKEKYPNCRISIITIIPRISIETVRTIADMIEMYRENEKLKQEGLLESNIYAESPERWQSELIADTLDELFSRDEFNSVPNDKTVEEIIEMSSNQVFRVGEKAPEVMKLLQERLLEEYSKLIRQEAIGGIISIDRFLKAAKDKQEQREQERQRKEREQGIKRDRDEECFEDLNELDDWYYIGNLNNARDSLEGILEYLDTYLSIIKK